MTKNQAGRNENPGTNDGANEKVQKIAQPDRADEVGHYAQRKQQLSSAARSIIALWFRIVVEIEKESVVVA